MANYYTPTVIQPPIPSADMTPLERLLLGEIFTAESEGDAVYFYAEECPGSWGWVDRAALDDAFAASSSADGTAFTYVAERLPDLSPGPGLIELDLSEINWETVFQDIVRRSPTLPYVTAVASFECSQMRPDAFGGMATLITADRIFGKSTDEVLAEFFDEAGLDR
jgi:hypothetical protein